MQSELEKQLEEFYFELLMEQTIDYSGQTLDGVTTKQADILYRLEKAFYNGRMISPSKCAKSAPFKAALARYKSLPLIQALEEM